eukprot:Rhum_TRINITY_DN10721_c0_g1::Rhum_TRINITY_DN10721_c0_g1_i1::g.39915::m.39915
MCASTAEGSERREKRENACVRRGTFLRQVSRLLHCGGHPRPQVADLQRHRTSDGRRLRRIGVVRDRQRDLLRLARRRCNGLHLLAHHVHPSERHLRQHRPLPEHGHPQGIRLHRHVVRVRLVPLRALHVVLDRLRRLLLRVLVLLEHAARLWAHRAQLHLAVRRLRPLRAAQPLRAHHRHLQHRVLHLLQRLHRLRLPRLPRQVRRAAPLRVPPQHLRPCEHQLPAALHAPRLRRRVQRRVGAVVAAVDARPACEQVPHGHPVVGGGREHQRRDARLCALVHVEGLEQVQQTKRVLRRPQLVRRRSQVQQALRRLVLHVRLRPPLDQLRRRCNVAEPHGRPQRRLVRRGGRCGLHVRSGGQQQLEGGNVAALARCLQRLLQRRRLRALALALIPLVRLLQALHQQPHGRRVLVQRCQDQRVLRSLQATRTQRGAFGEQEGDCGVLAAACHQRQRRLPVLHSVHVRLELQQRLRRLQRAALRCEVQRGRRALVHGQPRLGEGGDVVGAVGDDGGVQEGEAAAAQERVFCVVEERAGGTCIGLCNDGLEECSRGLARPAGEEV